MKGERPQRMRQEAKPVLVPPALGVSFSRYVVLHGPVRTSDMAERIHNPPSSGWYKQIPLEPE